MQEQVFGSNIGRAGSGQGLFSQPQLQVFGLKFGLELVQFPTVLLHLQEQVAASKVGLLGSREQKAADLSHSHEHVAKLR